MDGNSEVIDEQNINRCTRCGSCQSVCPIFKELVIESSAARGKIRLIRGVMEKELSITNAFEEKMSLCLMCKACVANCGSGVKVDKFVETARKEIVEKKGLHPLKRIIFRGVLKNRWIFNAGMRMGSIFQYLLFRKGPNGTGMLPRMYIGIDTKRLIGNLADKPLRALYPEVIKVSKAKMRAAFFTGCMVNYMYTETGTSVINILQKNGVEVVIPKLQNCCGTPVRINGDYESAIEMAKANLDVLSKENYDVIVVACGTCGLALKEEYAELLKDDPVYSEKAKRVGSKVKDITELVTSLEGYQEMMGRLNLKVTYHDACHLVRGMKVRDQPRQIISSIPGVEFIEMSKPDTCCGSGGSFSLYHYDLAAKINDHKIEDIRQTGAELVITGCSLCRMHITDGFNRNHINARIMHTADLLNMAYGQSSR